MKDAIIVKNCKRPKLEKFKRQTFPQNQRQFEMAFIAQNVQNKNNDATEFYHREMTSPPSIDCSTLKGSSYDAQAQTVVQIPRTTSVPIYNPFYTTFSLADHSNILNQLDETIPATSMPIFAPSLSTTSINDIDYITYCNSSSVPILSTIATTSNNSHKAIEIASESPIQNFTLSASTSSVAFYSAPNETTTFSMTPLVIKELSKMSGGSNSGSTSTQSSSWSNQPPPSLLQHSQRRFPSRTERLHLTSHNTPISPLTISNVIEEDFLANSEINKATNDFLNTTDTLKHTTELHNMAFHKKSSLPNVITTFLTQKECKKTDSKPVPPLRKPCCSTDGFPFLPEDLFNETSSSMTYSTILERAIRPVLEDIEMTTSINSNATFDSQILSENNKLMPNNVVKSNSSGNNNKNTFAVTRGPGITDV